MSFKSIALALASVLAAASCGDNLKAPTGPAELSADTTVELDCTTQAPGAGTVRAKLVVCDDEKVAGLLAAGREGDVLLENNLVRFIVRGPGEGFRLHGTTGGGIVDAALHGREDQLLEMQPLLDFGVGDFQEFVITSSGLSGGSEPGVAELVIRGSLVPIPLVASVLSAEIPNLILEQRYRLYPDTTHIEITTRAFPVSGDSPDVAGLRDVLFLGGELLPFVPGKGFLETASANGRFLASEGGESSYGLIYPDHPNSLLNVFELNGLFLLQALDLTTGADAERRNFIVGDGSTSSITDVAYALAQDQLLFSLAGSAGPGSLVAIHNNEERAVSRVRADASGKFSAQLPPDSYQLQSVREGALPGPLLATTLSDTPVTGLIVQDGEGGHLDISVADAGGSAMPARVMVNSTGFSQVVHVSAESASIPLPPGDYSVSVSRGIEFGLFEQQVLTIADGVATVLDVVLEREVDTDGWIAVDSHLHSEMSTDSSVPLAERLLSVVGEGVEVAISTDHDFVTDYAPYVAQLGIEEYLATQPGAEVSSTIVGHINGWPLEVEGDEAAAGAASWFGQAPGQIAKLIRDGKSDRIVQINHPRRNASATFNAIDLDPTTLTSGADPEDLGMPGADLNDFDFDAIEVANAKADESFEEVFRDWLAFLMRGHRKTATGSSDSHSTTAYSGRSRTYVAVGAGLDNPGTLDLAALNQAIASGKATVSQGAFVTIEADDPIGMQSYGAGEVAPLEAQAQVNLHVRVQAAAWLPVVKLVIYEGDQVVFEQALDSLETQALRFDQVVTLPLTGNVDTFFLARVESASSAPPVLSSPGPSFTNPVFIDRDGDGIFAP
jgi:hypothetical protein